MKKCNICGADLDDNAILCNVCGAPQLATDVQNTASQVESSANQFQNQAESSMNQFQNQATSSMNQFQNNANSFQSGADSFQGGSNQFQSQVNPFMTGNQMPGAMTPGAVDPYGNPTQSNFPRPTQSYSPEPSKSGSKKIIPILIIAAVVLVLAVVGLKFFGGGGALNKSVENYYKALGDLDGKAFFNAAFPEEVVDALDEQIKSYGSMLDTKDVYDYAVKYIMSTLGKNGTEKTQYKDIKIKNKKYADKDDLEDFSDELNQAFSTNIKVTAAQKFDVTYKYSTDGSTWLDGEDEAVAYKVGGKWYVISGLF